MGPIVGNLVNLAAISWLVIAMIFSTFPTLKPVTAQNMNYAIAVMGGWLIVGTAYFLFFGMKRYAGPMI
jgi:uncharacterized membrane protein YqgA involved in biofilm formation